MTAPTVCLSFDWDGVSVWMAGGATDARSMSRGEFGPRVGVPRLLELCKRLGISATFFTPGHTAETFPETAALIAAAGHEIAAHGYVHEDFEHLSLEAARGVIRRAADAIERVTGTRPRGMRFPPWAVEGEHFVMLLEEDFFRTFTKKAIVDARQNTEVLLCLSCESREEVDRYVARAEQHGGRAAREAKDHGFMYEHAFEDPDGHIWELVHMTGNPQ